MMFPVLLISSILGVSVQQIATKSYEKKNANSTFTFSALRILFALIVFVIISGGKLNFTRELVWYCIGFAAMYSMAVVAGYLAFATGPLSITALISQYSLICPTIYGILFLNEKTSAFLYVGILLLLISLFLVNMKDHKNERKTTLKWGLFTFLSFIGNGFCSVIQKVQQINMNGNYKNEFMVIALMIAFFAISTIALCTERKGIVKKVCTSAHCYVICGLSNGLVNLFVMMLAVWPASVVFPIISAGGIVASAIVGALVYKEKMNAKQIIGMALGIISIVLLNL